MLTATLTVLNIRCSSVVYVNSYSHSFKNMVFTYTTDEHLMFKTVRGTVNINY
jgi:hypothetical protein